MQTLKKYWSPTHCTCSTTCIIIMRNNRKKKAHACAKRSTCSHITVFGTRSDTSTILCYSIHNINLLLPELSCTCRSTTIIIMNVVSQRLTQSWHIRCTQNIFWVGTSRMAFVSKLSWVVNSITVHLACSDLRVSTSNGLVYILNHMLACKYHLCTSNPQWISFKSVKVCHGRVSHIDTQRVCILGRYILHNNEVANQETYYM